MQACCVVGRTSEIMVPQRTKARRDLRCRKRRGAWPAMLGVVVKRAHAAELRELVVDFWRCRAGLVRNKTADKAKLELS